MVGAAMARTSAHAMCSSAPPTRRTRPAKLASHCASEEKPARDHDKAWVDVDDEHAQRRGQRLQRGEVGERLARVDDGAETEQREQAAAPETERVLAQRQREAPHAGRREHKPESKQLRSAEPGRVAKLGEDRVGAERGRGDEHQRHPGPLSPAARSRRRLYGQSRWPRSMPIKTAKAYVTRGKRRTRERTSLFSKSSPLRSASDSWSMSKKATSDAAVAMSERIASGVKVTSWAPARQGHTPGPRGSGRGACRRPPRSRMRSPDTSGRPAGCSRRSASRRTAAPSSRTRAAR